MDYGMLRSDYLRVMMGDRKKALAPYRPEQINDLGDTSFDVASLSDEDINSAIKQMTGTQYENSEVFKSLSAEQSSRKAKSEQENANKPWWQQFGDFISNVGTSITEGILNVVDSVYDFGIGAAAGIFGGGFFGAQNDFTDWAAKAMTDDRWIAYATKAMTIADVFDKDFWTNGGGFWTDWSYENIAAQQARDYEGQEWVRKGGNFVGELVPSLLLAYFTGGASLGVQAATQAGLGFARGMGEAQSRALAEGASFQESAGYGAVKGAISGALSGALTYAGGTFASRSADSFISQAGNKVGDAILAKTGSTTLSAFANNATKFVIRVAGDAGETAVLTAIEPAFQQIYNENAWYNAYGTEENRKAYAEQIGKAALTAAAFSAVTNAARDVWSIHKAGGTKNYMEQYEDAAYRRVTENQILNSLSRSDRRMAQQGTSEWQRIQSDMERVQAEYDTMKAKGVSDTELQLFINKNKTAISQQVDAFSNKYGKLFTKLSAKSHPDVLGTTENASINSARSATFQKFSSMSNKGAREQLSNLFNGQNGVAALITYTSGSNPVETVKENDALVAKPKNFEQVQSVLAAAANDRANVPSIIELPLKGGSSVRLDISVIAPKQLEGIAFLRESDLKPNANGAVVAELGNNMALALTSDRTAGQIVTVEAAKSWAKPTEAELVPPSAAVEPVETTPTPVKPLNLKAGPSVVKMAAEGKPGKVYNLSSTKSMVSAIEDSIQDLLSLDNIGGKTKLDLQKGATSKEIFDTLNLGSEQQKADLKEYLRNKLLDMNVGYELKNYYGETLDSYSGSWREFLATMDKTEMDKFNSDFNEFYGKLLASGSESEMSKVIRYFTDKITAQAEKSREFKVQTKITRHIDEHKTKLLRRYYHNDGKDFGPDFNFDNQGYKVLLEPLHGLKKTANGQSYSGSSAVEAFKKFVDTYKLDNFAKKNDAGEIVSTSSLYNQGLRDLANLLIDSIETHSHVDKNGKVIYSALSSEELSILRQFQDAVEEMPKLITKDTLAAVSDAKAAYHGVERYVSSIVKNDKVGMVRNFIQGYAERYANQLDTLMFEIGDNELSRAIYNELYLSQAQSQGMRDDFQGKINAIREKRGITNKKLNTLSSTFKDTSGKPIEMKYLVRIYQHMLAGEESNNVKYINANSVYIRDSKGKLIHVAKFSYSDMDTIATELKNSGLYAYMTDLHRIESGDLGDIYDQDYVRDTHIQNSNRMKEYTAIKLESNKVQLGKAYVKQGVARYGQQKDRVDKIPAGVHLVIQDPESMLMSQVANQANIHFNDPVLKKISGMLSTRINDKGTTVKEYLAEHNPGALKLIERAIWGAYGINPNKAQHIIDFVGNGYVMSLIGLNPGSILRQPLSIMWSNDISMASVLRFTIGANLNRRIWQNSTRLIGEIEKEFPALKLRGKKNEALIGNTAAEAIGKVQTAIGKVAGFGLKMTDAWTVGHEAVGLLAMQAQKLGYGEIGTPENDEYVEYHYRAFYATQVSSDRITMSGGRAGYYGGIGKFTSFMTGAVQGQIGYLLRAAQQIQEFGGKTQEYFDGRIETTKQAEEDAKNNYEDAARFLDETEEAYERDEAESEDVKSARESAKEAFDKYTSATGERADAETSAKGFRHFKDMGGAKGVVTSRLASMLVTGLALVLISELTARLKGQKAWNEFDMSSAGIDLAINSTVGWMPVARDLINAWKGYDLDIPEYAMVRQAYDFISAIAKVAQDPSDKSARALLRQTIETVSAFLGIPAMNLWKYANGIIKTFSPATALKMNNLLYGASPTSLASTAKEYAEKNDISTAADLYQSLYAIAKTGEISREIAVEEAKLVQEGFSPVARNIPDYIQNEEGERVILSDDQKTDFSKTYSKANKIVVRLIKSARYKNMDSETKAKSIKKVYDLYYEAARYKALGIEPDSRLGKLLAYAGDYDGDILATLLLIQQNSELVDNRQYTKKEQALRIVNQQSMPKAQKLLTLYLMGYGVTSENKKLVKSYLASIGFKKEQVDEFIPS